MKQAIFVLAILLSSEARATVSNFGEIIPQTLNEQADAFLETQAALGEQEDLRVQAQYREMRDLAQISAQDSVEVAINLQ